ncbi:MAG: hypothetical protein ABI780_12670, partial [Ardenticatenales bacterium]
GADGAADTTPYRYAVPAVIADGHRTTIVHVQNADVVCNEADVTLVGASGTTTVCAHLSLPPGESRDVDLAACAPANPVDDVGPARSAATVAGTGPLAIAVDIAGIAAGWPVLASYAAPNPAAPPAIGAGVGTTLLAALPIGRPADGQFGTDVVVQNAAADRAAHVTVRFLDRAGDPSAAGDASAEVPAGAAAVFAVPRAGAGGLASARIDSVADSDDPAAPPAAPLAAVVVHGRATAGSFASASPQDWSAADIVPAIQDPRAGTVADAIRTTRLALADVVRAKGATKDTVGRVSVIALQNRIEKPGFTDIVVYFYDGNGLLDYICQKLNERQVEYIDLSSWGYINPGFRGSTLVSAWFWEHDIFDDQGFFVANLVDLGAAYGQSGPNASDGQTWTSAVPFAKDFPLGDTTVPLCASFPDLRPAP